MRTVAVLAVLVASIAYAAHVPLTRTSTIPGVFPQLWGAMWDDATERIAKLKRAATKRLDLTRTPLNEDEEMCLRAREMENAIRTLWDSAEGRALESPGAFQTNLQLALTFLRDTGKDEPCGRPGPAGIPNRGALLSPGVQAAQARSLIDEARERLGVDRPLTWMEAAAIVGAAILAAPILAPL